MKNRDFQSISRFISETMIYRMQWRRNVSQWDGSSRPTFKSGTARNAFYRPTFWPQTAYCTYDWCFVYCNVISLSSNFSGNSLKLMPPDALICTKFKKVEWNGNHSVNNGPMKRLTNSACLQVYMSNDHANFRTYFTKKLSAPTGSFTV